MTVNGNFNYQRGSSFRRDELTHIGGIMEEFGVNAVLTPPAGSQKDLEPWVVDLSIHTGPKNMRYGITTANSEALINAGIALIQAGKALEDAQREYIEQAWEAIT